MWVRAEALAGPASETPPKEQGELNSLPFDLFYKGNYFQSEILKL